MGSNRASPVERVQLWLDRRSPEGPAGRRRAIIVLTSFLATCLALAVLCLVAPLVAAVAAAAVVVVLAPVGRTVTSRVGAVLLIWLSLSQFAYVVTWPVSFPPRQAVAWTVAAIATLVWRVVRWPASGRWWVPVRLGPPVVALLAVVASVVWWFWPWRGDLVHVVDRLLLGWDNAAHFAMVEQLRAPDAAAAGMNAGYPRGYHSLVASLMELGWGPPAGLDSELVAFAYTALVVCGASIVLVAAFILDAPVFWRRPVLLLPATAALVTLFLQLQDAAQVPYLGFGNFLEAVGMAGAGTLVAVRWTRREDAWRWFLFGCAAAGIVGTWTLLLAFLVPVPVAVWLARRPFESSALRRLASRAAPAVVVVALALLAQPPVTRSVGSTAQAQDGLLAKLDHFLLLDGGVGTSAVGLPILLVLAGVAVPLGLALRGRRSPTRLRVAWLWLPAGAAVGTALAMLIYEAVRVGEPRYYGIKTLCAATLVAGSVALVTSAYAVDVVLRRQPTSLVAKAAVAAMTAVLLLFDGAPVQLGPLPASFGGDLRAYNSSDAPDRRQPVASAILAACAAVAGKPGEYYLLVAGANHDDLVRGNVWLITCGLDWNIPNRAAVLGQQIPDQGGDGRTVVDLTVDTKRILQARPRARVVVSSVDSPLALQGLAPAEKDRVVVY